MAISIKTQKRLWGDSANRCAMCREKLVISTIENSNAVNIGEMCHIVAQSIDGPRGDINFPKDQLDEYENLIILCPNDHKKIDSDPEYYTIDKLKEIKKEHEDYVHKNLSHENSLNNEVIKAQYLNIIEKWAEDIDLYNWENWTSSLLFPNYKIEDCKLEQLIKLKNNLYKIIYPNEYENLKNSIKNFELILGEFISIFGSSYVDKNEAYEYWYIPKTYKQYNMQSEVHKKLLKEYNYLVEKTINLICELTRAANLICSLTRQYIDPSFMQNYGYISIIDYGILKYSEDQIKQISSE